MSKDAKQLSQVDDTISTEGEIPGSSVSLTIRTDDILIREKPKLKPEKEPDPPQPAAEQKKEQWWLKKTPAPAEQDTQDKTEVKKVEARTLSPDMSSSMKEFLDKEKMCRKDDAEAKEYDTVHDILASAAFDKYQSDLDNATDDDISGILEEMSKIAGAMSPVPTSVKSKSVTEILTEEEQSVEELLQEAERLVQSNSNDFLKGVLKTSITIPDDDNSALEGLTRVRQLEVDIFSMIEQKTSDHKSTNDTENTSIEVLFENLNVKTPLELPKTKFDDQKAEVSSNNSDLDDPIERHSISEDAKAEEKSLAKKECLKKEITDVDKDFFEVLIKRTKENAEQLSSRSSSFDKEDFTEFLKLLQDHSEKESKEMVSKTSSLNLVVEQFDPLKEKTANQEKQLVNVEPKKIVCQSSAIELRADKLIEDSSQVQSSRQSSRCSSKKSSASAKGQKVEAQKVIVNDKKELYEIGLTPRLELFADTIPKLKAEKSIEESSRKDEDKKSENGNEASPRSEENEDFSFKNRKVLNALRHTELLNDHKNITDVKDYNDLIDFKERQIFDHQGNVQNFNYFQNSAIYSGCQQSNDHTKVGRVINASGTQNYKDDNYLEKSRSYDQLCKPSNKFGSSLENVRNINSADVRKQTSTFLQKKSAGPKVKVQPKTVTKFVPKTKVNPKIKREPVKPFQSNTTLDIRGTQIRPYESARKSLGGGDWKTSPGEETLETLYQAERERFMHLRMEFEAEIDTYKAKLNDVYRLHEEETIPLKKQNILLKAKIDDLTQQLRRSADPKSRYDPKIMSMQKELERQENMITAYEAENKKLMQETKRLQNELKSNGQQKQKVIAIDHTNSNQELVEKLKDLQEENVKFNFELLELKDKNNDLSLKNEDVTQQNSLLQEELEMIKDQLRAKNEFITDRLQAMTTNELDLRKQVEDLKVELHSKTEQLKSIRTDFENYQQSVAPFEKELIELRTKCTYYQEKLQTAKNNCEREKQLTQKLKDQVILDNKNIMDLNRQVREMERILKRKNPDSVSALILTANSEGEKLNAEKVKLLEDRIAFLENEIKAREDMAETKLSEIQSKFSEMKDKYSAQVSELEQKLRVSPRERKIFSEVSTQTMHRILESRNSEPNLAEKVNNNNGNGNKAGPKSQNLKEDTHLIATIRGLKQELVNKDKCMTKISRELQELQKTNRKLQKEREKLLNERKNLEKYTNRVMTSSDSKLSSLKLNEGNDPNSNFYQNGHLSDAKKLSSSMQRLYDSTQFMENTEIINKIKTLTSENEVLKEELGRLNKDFAALKNKRLQDLNLLQEEHEKEIALIIKECTMKVGDTKALKLQGQVNSQIAMISHLREQIQKLQEYKEQVLILKAERDHLEGKNRILNEKVKYLTTPSSQQLQILQEKIAILQQRHESRELSLQKLVRDLLRNRNQGCRDCRQPLHDGKSQQPQLCYFRKELDNILGTLQDLTSP